MFIADNRRLACAVELSSTSKVSRMPGTDNDSAINVHLCRNGMSAAYENQTLARLLS